MLLVREAYQPIGGITITVTFHAGLGRSVTNTFAEGTTLGQALDVVKPALSLGNVVAATNGVTLAPESVITDQQVVQLESVAHSKAV